MFEMERRVTARESQIMQRAEQEMLQHKLQVRGGERESIVVLALRSLEENPQGNLWKKNAKPIVPEGVSMIIFKACIVIVYVGPSLNSRPHPNTSLCILLQLEAAEAKVSGLEMKYRQAETRYEASDLQSPTLKGLNVSSRACGAHFLGCLER